MQILVWKYFSGWKDDDEEEKKEDEEEEGKKKCVCRGGAMMENTGIQEKPLSANCNYRDQL